MSSGGNSFVTISSYILLLDSISSTLRIGFLTYFLFLNRSAARSAWTMVGRGWSWRQADPLLTGENNKLMDPLEELLSVPEIGWSTKIQMNKAQSSFQDKLMFQINCDSLFYFPEDIALRHPRSPPSEKESVSSFSRLFSMLSTLTNSDCVWQLCMLRDDQPRQDTSQNWSLGLPPTSTLRIERWKGSPSNEAGDWLQKRDISGAGE